MISYGPLWETMKKKNVTTYSLIKTYGFSKGTLDRLKHGLPITTVTLDDLCRILDCGVSDIIKYTPEDNTSRP